MGISRASNVTSAIIDRFLPSDVVVMGIAGSLASEMQPGDVFVPDRVVEYLANSATVAADKPAVGKKAPKKKAPVKKEEWTFETSGNHFNTDPRLLNRWENLATTKEKVFTAWRQEALERFGNLISEEAIVDLNGRGLHMRRQSELVPGDDRGLASGPAVGKGEAFVTWLKTKVDRKLAAIEMESAGVYDAAFIRTPAPRVIAIRGISDFADERKKTLEEVAKGGFRALAIKNAITLFIAAVKADIFANDEGGAAARAPPEESLVKKVFVIGGVTDETVHPKYEAIKLQRACFQLGVSLSEGGVRLVVCSPFTDSADCHTVIGFCNNTRKGVIEYHSPMHPDVQKEWSDLIGEFGNSRKQFEPFEHPGYENKESISQAWLLAQLKAVESADVVVAIGGKISKTASTLLHLAEDRGLPIVPYTFLKGAAQRSFARSKWEKLHPKINPADLNSETGITKVIEIANQIILDKLSTDNKMLSRPKTVFISRANEDAAIAEDLSKDLKSSDITVLMGESSIDSRQMVQATIVNNIEESDLFIALWSKHYALSRWCYDELALALKRAANKSINVWMFCLDNTQIVPSEARKLRAIRITSVMGLLRVTRELLSKIAEEEPSEE
jgi:nucleoside phosphorylase